MSVATDVRAVRKPVVAGVSHGAARRVMDIVVASLAGVALSPVMLLIVLALMVEGGRPVFFVQTRIGSGGRLFSMYKFRKFHTHCGEGLALTLANDKRMTRIGRILAATKLDELPQLWNVLRGDMAIIGPRPESLAFADCFRNGFEAVLKYKPGLLGPSQIRFRSEALFYPADADPTVFYREVLFPEKARTDIAYYAGRTILSDIRLIASGLLVVVVVGRASPVKL